MKKEILILAGLMIVILLIAPSGAYQTYYNGPVCEIPNATYFESVPGGTLNYQLNVVDRTYDHYAPGDIFLDIGYFERNEHKWQLSESHAMQERLELNRALYCYTVPDYEPEEVVVPVVKQRGDGWEIFAS